MDEGSLYNLSFPSLGSVPGAFIKHHFMSMKNWMDGWVRNGRYITICHDMVLMEWNGMQWDAVKRNETKGVWGGLFSDRRYYCLA